MMKVSDFQYDLPDRLIAQEPAPQRDASRLMVLDRRTGARQHARFRDLPRFLEPGDLLILNDTEVLPARLEARKATGGRIEVLLLERVEPRADGGGDGTAGRRQGGVAGGRQEWRALVRGFGRRAGGARFTFPGGVTAEVIAREASSGGAGTGAYGEVVRVLLEAEGSVEEALRAAGRPPTPPYIRREIGDPRLGTDRDRYQTVYASSPGAVAAPTAGLHFTRGLLDEIRARGVEVESLTLHVGWGTFKPVRVENVEEHRVDPEPCVVPRRLAEAFESLRRRGGRAVAVGTTVARALEHSAEGEGIRPGGGRCDLVIRPGHRFRAIDALVTNFHLPGSSLLFLVAAFAGRDRILDAYREAIEMEYRFYSYGDAMLIL
jgi:S-adenosylmethionine:tRNA ribosyltransferase-isomerase